MYCRLYLGVEADAFGGKIIFSGLLNGGALVLLLWIYFFTLAHEREGQVLQSLVINVTEAVMGDGALMQEETLAKETGGAGDSEF